MDSSFANNEQVVSFTPTVNSEYVYEFDDADQVIQEMGKGGHRTCVTARHKIRILYKILQKSNDGYLVSIKFLLYDIENASEVGSDGEHLEKNSTYFHTSINSLKEAIFKLNLALNGNIDSVSGYQEYYERSLALNENPFNKNYFKELFNRITELFPGHKVGMGSTWKHHRFQGKEVEYLLENIDDNLAKIRSVSHVKQQLLVMETALVMNGTEYGEIEVEASTGMPRNFDSIMKLSGICKIGAVDVAQSVVKTSRMIGNKIT